MERTRCPGHTSMVYVGPTEDDYDPYFELCDGSCVDEPR